jgi:hypothetical protein
MPCAVPSNDLALFQCLLIGTWTNDKALTHEGKPLSFNVMPLPQKDPQITRPSNQQNPDYGGFILKNFTFTETIRFNGSAKKGDPDHQDPEAVAVVAGAPNRGGSYTQFAHAVFYEQQVHFAEGPDKGKIVHIENGAWLHLGSLQQVLGPYDPNNNGPYVQGQVLRQPPYITIAKQIAVPHGNSVLALGNVDLYDLNHFSDDNSGIQANTILHGAPVIPDAFVPYPAPADISTAPSEDPYAALLNTPDDYENPNTAWTLNPNYPLQVALGIIKPKAHIHFRVTTRPVFGGTGVVTNIPFEERKSKVTEYWADYWLLSKDADARKTMNFEYLAYTQTILMEMQISTDGGKTYNPYIFPHVTSNTVKKVPGTPTAARDKTKTELED